MIFLGYDFLRDKYCWQPTPTDFTNINNIRIENGIYDHMNITKDVDFDYTTELPGKWNLQTQFDADFNGTITAGNVDYILAQISSIKVKRRVKGTFDWATLFTIPISKVSDVDFVRYDYIAKNNETYEYAIVPVIGNTEGEYSINSIKSEFYGIFITDNKSSYKFLEGASYSGNERSNQTGIFEPYGSKYPVVIKNGVLSYDKGTLTGIVITFDANQELDREGTIERLKAIENFLTEPTGKILKDFNGNIWLVSITDNIPVTYYSEVGMGFAQISFNWNEIGNATDSSDLYYNNLIEDIN